MKFLAFVLLLAAASAAPQGEGGATTGSQSAQVNTWEKSELTYKEVKTVCEGMMYLISYEDGSYKNMEPIYYALCLVHVDILRAGQQIAHLHVTATAVCDDTCRTETSPEAGDKNSLDANAYIENEIGEHNENFLRDYISENVKSRKAFLIETVEKVMAEVKEKANKIHQQSKPVINTTPEKVN